MERVESDSDTSSCLGLNKTTKGPHINYVRGSTNTRYGLEMLIHSHSHAVSGGGYIRKGMRQQFRSSFMPPKQIQHI